MTSILHHYQQLQARLDLNGFEQGIMRATTERITFDDITQLDERLISVKPIQGWLCFQSTILRHYTAESLPLRNDETGYLLSAEFVLPEKDDQARSLHIRMADTAWQLTLITEKAVNSRFHLIEKTRFLAMSEHPRAEKEENEKNETIVTNDFLQYRINWQHNNQHGYQPRLYRFAGFNRKVTHVL